jgi:hypothetical protein
MRRWHLSLSQRLPKNGLDYAKVESWQELGSRQLIGCHLSFQNIDSRISQRIGHKCGVKLWSGPIREKAIYRMGPAATWLRNLTGASKKRRQIATLAICTLASSLSLLCQPPFPLSCTSTSFLSERSFDLHLATIFLVCSSWMLRPYRVCSLSSLVIESANSGLFYYKLRRSSWALRLFFLRVFAVLRFSTTGMTMCDVMSDDRLTRDQSFVWIWQKLKDCVWRGGVKDILVFYKFIANVRTIFFILFY